MKKEQKSYLRFAISIGAAILSAFIMAVGNNCLIEDAKLLPGGFLGLARLIGVVGTQFGVQIPTIVVYLGLNVALAIFCGKHISKKFVLFSVIQFVSLSLFMQILPSYEIFDQEILNVVFGGVIWGFGISIVLRNGGSTGGTDFIALYVSNKTGNEIWSQVFLFNCLQLAVFGMLSGWEHAGYSIIFQYISTHMINVFHNRYKRVMLQIFTKDPEKVCRNYIAHFAHGVTILKGQGGYTGEDTFMLTAITSSYEVEDAIEVILEADSRAFINVTKSDKIVGKFNQPEL